MNKFDKLDTSTKFLLRLDFILLIALVVGIVTYYQIKPAWELDHNTAILYSFILSFGVGGLTVLSVRHYRKRK